MATVLHTVSSLWPEFLFRSVKDKSYFWAKFLKKKRILDKFNSSKYSVLGKNFTVYVTKKSGGKLEAPGVCEGGYRYPKKLYSSIHTPFKLTENWGKLFLFLLEIIKLFICTYLFRKVGLSEWGYRYPKNYTAQYIHPLN